METPVQTESMQRREDDAREPEPAPKLPVAFQVRDLSIWYGAKQAVANVSLDILRNQVTAIIGPSGCGKSTFLRCLNRMHELVPNTRVEGRILFEGADLYGPSVEPGDHSPSHRDGFPEIESVSDHVDPGQRRRRLEAQRGAEPQNSRRTNRESAAHGGALG